MFRITYQVKTYLAMEQMGWEEWQKCLRLAAHIVAKHRHVLACIAQGKTSGWDSDTDFQQWLADEEFKLNRDGKQEKALALRDPRNIEAALKGYADWLKCSLPGACFQAADFAESVGKKKYNKGKRGRWREQAYAYLSGLAVIDVDHVDNPQELFERIKSTYDLKALGILLVYVSASGKGIKIVFKARTEWANLICNQYEMAELLGILDYVDDACKDSSRLSFLTGPDDVLYVDSESLFNHKNAS